MNDNVLQIVKKLLGIDPSIDAFDMDIRMHVNSVLLNLEQLGVGLKIYSVNTGNETFGDLTDDTQLAGRLPTYFYLKVRLLFDPPSTSFVIDAIQKQIQEIEWRLNVEYEGEEVSKRNV